ncbi:capsular polysaccharide biosynthesis protein [Rhizobium sp. FKL33]|uniref:capsular polysaccharide biosynthesis protein n=1 Tax=Rhizobium sp. FKL33 TaxID=2562307 RepID=UPI0010C078AF|nr:capsular polysaccharide biosynthesis protein [Rhizobium sp. FKL33]
MGKDGRPLYAATSLGLWRQRSDIETLLDCRLVFWPAPTLGRSIDGYVGWGRRPSGFRAASLASKTGLPGITLEDGYLKSYAPGAGEPAHSFVVDRSGIYFEPLKRNDLSELIDRPGDGDVDTARAQAAIDFIRRNRISKYNNSPLKELDEAGLQGAPYVLLVDQVPGDASLRGAGADDGAFASMLRHAIDHYPRHRIAVRTHPAAGDNSLILAAAKAMGVSIVATPRMNPWPLVEGADAVFTVSSQLGFEALLAGCKVHTFGITYYSHRGLTIDHADTEMWRPKRTIEQLFHAAYIDYSRYLDLHDRRPVEIEVALEQLLTVRDQRARIVRRVYTGGLSPWKRRAMTPFLIGPDGPPVHCRSIRAAEQQASQNGGQVALWGAAKPLPKGAPAIRFEDGFIRSRGLGVNLSLPCSLAMDGQHVYFDARGESFLENIFATHPFPEDLLARARALIDLVVSRGVSKYNLQTDFMAPVVDPGRLKILAPGQVEKDASIRYGSPAVKANRDLVARIRGLYPEAFIVYKEHPDVTAGLRSGGEPPVDADLIVTEGDIKHWIAWADRLETMTSLAGFEALIRNKPVGVHGAPFYAGWGVTDDHFPIPRRQRRLTTEMLAAGALILYPLYVHPLSGMPCSPEALVEEIALNRQVPMTPIQRLRAWLAQSINRTAVKIRDASN